MHYAFPAVFAVAFGLVAMTLSNNLNVGNRSSKVEFSTLIILNRLQLTYKFLVNKLDH